MSSQPNPSMSSCPEQDDSRMAGDALCDIYQETAVSWERHSCCTTSAFSVGRFPLSCAAEGCTNTLLSPLEQSHEQPHMAIARRILEYSQKQYNDWQYFRMEGYGTGALQSRACEWLRKLTFPADGEGVQSQCIANGRSGKVIQGTSSHLSQRFPDELFLNVDIDFADSRRSCACEFSVVLLARPLP